MRKRTGEVVAIKDLFSKYKATLRAPQKTVETEVVRVVGEVTGLRLQETQVTYTVSTRTVSIQAPSLIKQELKLRQTELLKALKQNLGAKSAPLHIL
jgi:hypothetical protein